MAAQIRMMAYSDLTRLSRQLASPVKQHHQGTDRQSEEQSTPRNS